MTRKNAFIKIYIFFTVEQRFGSFDFELHLIIFCVFIKHWLKEKSLNYQI